MIALLFGGALGLALLANLAWALGHASGLREGRRAATKDLLEARRRGEA